MSFQRLISIKLKNYVELMNECFSNRDCIDFSYVSSAKAKQS